MVRSIAYYENRINTLKHRPKENQNIIRKLERYLRKIKQSS